MTTVLKERPPLGSAGIEELLRRVVDHVPTALRVRQLSAICAFFRQ